MNKKYFYRIVALSLTATLLSCNSKVEEKPAAQPEENTTTVELTDAQHKSVGIELGKVEERQISGTIKASGKLDVPPQQLVSISVPLGGFLKNTELLQGSHVTKGQVIATIENLDFIQLQQDYLEAKSQLEFSKADYERQQLLARENVNAQKTLDQSKASFESWQAKANGLRGKLKMLNIQVASVEAGNITSIIHLYAPISGYVTEVNVNIGKFVSPTDIMFEIVDTEHLHAELTVFEKDVLKIKIGQTVRFVLANETKERTAKVFLIGREISADRTIRIHCHIDREDKSLLPGMYLKAAVEIGGALVRAVPDQAIVNFQGKQYIFISTDEASTPGRSHQFTMMEVQTGNSEFNYTEIIVAENTEINKLQVVTKGAYELLSKMKNSEEE
jgi:cobalt-zinc-cadmium efflux system membrane fusion protein